VITTSNVVTLLMEPFSRDISSRAAKERCDAGYGVGPTGLAVYLDFSDAINRLGRSVIEERYGNLFQMYEKIVDEILTKHL